MASRQVNGHFNKRDNHHASWSFRKIKRERERADRENAQKKRLQIQTRAQIHWLRGRHRRVLREWSQAVVVLASVWTFSEIHSEEIRFWIRMSEFTARKEAFLARADHASLEELTWFRHCGMKFSYRSQKEAEEHRESMGRQNLVQ